MGNDDKIIIEIDGAFECEELKKKTIRVLSFSLSGQDYCVKIEDAKETVKLQRVTAIPNMPEFVAGVINLHGEIIALLDIRPFLNIEKKDITRTSRVIVTDVTGVPIGILVDEIKNIIDIEEESIQPPLATLRGVQAEYIKGHIELDGRIFALLDLKRILKCEDVKSL